MKIWRSWQNILHLAALSFGLAACSQSANFFNLPDSFSAFRRANLLASDQSSLKAGQKVLDLGGNAADATIAMGFAAFISLPARTSLHAQGVCVGYSPKDKRAFSIDFTQPGTTVLHGLIALYAQHGKAKWSALLAPAHRRALLGGGAFSTLLNGNDAAMPDHLRDQHGNTLPRPVLTKVLEVLMQNPLNFTKVAPFANNPKWRNRIAITASNTIQVGDSLLAIPVHSSQARFTTTVRPTPSSGTPPGVLFGAMDANGLGIMCGVALDTPYGANWDDDNDSALPGETFSTQPLILPKLFVAYTPNNDKLKWIAGFAPEFSDAAIAKSWDTLLEDNLVNLDSELGYAMSYCPIGLPNAGNDNPIQCITYSGMLGALGHANRQ
ncbi:MAG: hypothetical protein HRT36_03640 [Alphaproteobacteria bacterium]|nr:hypothetical protein [Alphaproteobacteria bacterium]